MFLWKSLVDYNFGFKICIPKFIKCLEKKNRRFRSELKCVQEYVRVRKTGTLAIAVPL